MSDLVRLSLSIEKPLFDRLERLVRSSGYSNRSEFVRDMIRQQLVKRDWERNQEVLGAITLVYNHHQRRLAEKLTDLQHHHHDHVLVATHVHLTKELCAEVILVRGKAGTVEQLAKKLGEQKGVLHSDLSMSSTGRALK